jgi:RHS repeat-associated protein
VKRNLDRFPEDFMFQLTYQEVRNLIFHFGISSWGGTRKLPRAFTEQVTDPISPALSANVEYDALGRRISKTINGVTTQFLYDGKDIVQEIGGGAVGASYLRSLNVDEPFVRQSGSNEYYHTDAIGSILALTDETGAVTTSYAYEAFGKTTITGSSTNPFQYTGRENDGTGLYFYRARYYGPQLQRFVSEDTLLSPLVIQFLGNRMLDTYLWRGTALAGFLPWKYSELNKYGYISNNPPNLKDPNGLDPLPLCKEIQFTCKLYVRTTCVLFCALDPPTAPVCLLGCNQAAKIGCDALARSMKNAGRCTGELDIGPF